MIEYYFLFTIMIVLGFSKEFIDMVNCFLGNASTCIKVNGTLSKYFPIIRGMRQGCPLVLYLFLIVGEAINTMITKNIASGTIQSI